MILTPSIETGLLEIPYWEIANLLNDGRILPELICEHGYVLCKDFPVDSPNELLNFAASVGSLNLQIDEELSGPQVMHIRYDPIKASRSERPAYFSTDAFPLHTDMSYVVNSPHYLFMLCITPNATGGGLSTLSDCRCAWKTLSRENQAELGTPQFRFRNPPNTSNGDSGLAAVTYAATHWRMWRFRLDSMTFPDRASESVRAFSSALDKCSVSFPLSCGDLLVVDNHTMTHGRTAFNCTASETPRHLVRTYAQDEERSRHLKSYASFN